MARIVVVNDMQVKVGLGSATADHMLSAMVCFQPKPDARIEPVRVLLHSLPAFIKPRAPLPMQWCSWAISAPDASASPDTPPALKPSLCRVRNAD